MKRLTIILLLSLLSTTGLLLWAQEELNLGLINLKVKPNPSPLIEQLLEGEIIVPRPEDLQLDTLDPLYFDHLELEVWL